MDYLIRLPDELKVKILSYLSTCDLIELGKVHQSWERLSCERSLSKNVCLYKGYKITTEQFTKFVSHKIRLEYITNLNINCCYWIPGLTLRRCIGKLCMLESLYVLDTNFQMCEQEVVVLGSLKHLKRLAITTGPKMLDRAYVQYFPKTLTGLCLHTVAPVDTNILKQLPLLVEIWLLCTVIYTMDHNLLLSLMPQTVQNITYYLNFGTFSYQNFSLGKVCTFYSRQNALQKRYEELNYEIENIFHNSWNPKDPNWKLLIDNLCCYPSFGLADAKKLILRQASLEDILYEELNFRHDPCSCSVRQKTAFAEILNSRNSKLLKKLSVSFCMCVANWYKVGVQDPPEQSPGFKRARVAYRPSKGSTDMESIVVNASLLEELEIWSCMNPDYLCLSGYTSLSCVQQLKKLTKLTLDGITTSMNCQFLVDICRGCDKLTSLRIRTSYQNGNLENYLYTALAYTTNLIDLRFEQPFIHLDRVFAALNNIKNTKLERLVLITDELDKFSVKIFESFLASKINLNFLYLYIKRLPTSKSSEIKRTLNKYKTSKQKIFIVVNEAGVDNAKLVVPHIHTHEMIRLNSFVSILDIFNGFR